LAALVIVLTTLLSHLVAFAIPPSEDELAAGLQSQPFQALLLPTLIVAITVLGTYLIGRLFGGQGSLSEIATVVVWLQFLMLMFEFVQIVALLLLGQFVAMLILAVTIGLYFWLFSCFVSVAHGFRSARTVFFTTIALVLTLSFVLAYIYLTLSPPREPSPV